MDENKNNNSDRDKTTDLQSPDEQKAAAAHAHHQDQDEEALSLRGLILNSDEVEFQERGRSSSADLSELFEFLNDRSSSEMSHAEDIIFCGKLVPYKERRPRSQDHHPHHQRSSTNHHFLKHPSARSDKKQSFHSRRSESLDELRTSRANCGKQQQHQFMRASRSLDYRKLYGNSSSRWTEKMEIERSASTKSSTGGRFDAAAATMAMGSKERIPRPRWYMMFGLFKFPAEMDFQDMKSRQVRRSPATLFASVDTDGKALVNRVSDRRCSSSWDLLRVLSCKDHASVAVATPFGCLQQI